MPFPNTSQRRRHDKATNNESADDDNDAADDRDDIGLLSKKRIRFVKDNAPNVPRHNWMRPYWLGVGLFLVLFPFWLLDSLKDPILGALTDSNLERHQPPAKLFSVCTTLALVCFLEYFSHEKKRQHQLEKIRSEQEVLEAGGSWNRMPMASDPSSSTEVSDDAVPSSIFALIGLPYCLAFGIMAYLLQFNPNVALTDAPEVTFGTNPQRLWATLGYFFFAAIESYGSLSVAAFWSYTNSTLSLEDAESFYGPIIAIAQLGAVCGSTMVTMQVWSNITLVVLACLIILLHILVMTAYNKRFPPTNKQIQEELNRDETTSNAEPTLWSGVYLILKHNYVLLIFGASSLYEISLTCLNYQMTLLGWRRFEETEHEDITVSLQKSETVSQRDATRNGISLLPWLVTVQAIHGPLWTDGQRDKSNSLIHGFSSADATRGAKINLTDIPNPVAGGKCACLWLFAWKFGGSLLVRESSESHDVQYSRSVDRALVFTNFQRNQVQVQILD